MQKNLVHSIRDKNHKGVRVDLAYDRDRSILDDKDVQNPVEIENENPFTLRARMPTPKDRRWPERAFVISGTGRSMLGKLPHG